MTGQTSAIVRVQLQSLRNYGRRAGMGTVLTILASVIWYGLWLAGTIVFTKFIAGAHPEQANSALTAGLFIIFLYWQITPLLMAATGFALDMRKLLVYPIAPARLFGIDLVLRAITSLESIFLLAGASIGVLMNRRLNKSGALAIVMFLALNLFVAAGVREIITRLFARRRTRELLVLVIVLLAATPQLIVLTNAGDKVTGVARRLNVQALPWSAAASAATGTNSAAQILVVGIWTAGAFAFGKRQFEKSLRFDADAAAASGPAKASGAARLMDRIQRWPSHLFRDPLAALLEKEIRTLARSPRFRLVFLMGFTFGLLIWFPIYLGRGGGGFMGRHFLSVVSAYALLLLGDVCFWNCFGFDRAAAQAYLVVPGPISHGATGEEPGRVWRRAVGGPHDRTGLCGAAIPYPSSTRAGSAGRRCRAECLPAGRRKPHVGIQPQADESHEVVALRRPWQDADAASGDVPRADGAHRARLRGAVGTRF